MVIAEKQNLSATDHRHRRMLERIFLGPRINRPRPELNSLLRSMDLFGLDRENFVDIDDVTSDPEVFHAPFQRGLLESFRDNVRSRRSYRVPGPDRPDGSPSTNKTISSHSHRQNHMKSEPDVHIIPINFIGDKKQSGTDAPSIIDLSSTKDQDVQCMSISTSDKSKSCDIPVVIIPDDSSDKSGGLSSNSLMVRQSLPRLTQQSRKHFNDSDLDNSVSDIIVIDEPGTNKEHESSAVKNVRSNKDTLVGGANKVLADMGPDGFVTTESMDPAGAAFLTSSHGAFDLSASHDLLPTSEEEKPVNEVPNYPVYSVLKTKLMKECRQIDYIKGDGNCFFRALSKQLYGSERYHIVIRNLIVDLIATNKNKFSQFVDGGDVQDHVERMSQEQSWATTCEIYAAATLLQRDIFMLTPDHLNEMYSWLLFKPVFKLDPQQSNIESHPCYITLCNTNGNHYDRIVGEHGGCNCFLPHPELEGVSYSVDLT